MTPQDIAQFRLYYQQIATTKFKEPSQVVSWLGAMQAQDYAGVKWSIGLRLPGATDADIERAIAAKTIIRTWPMRGTLHFVAPEDVRWMLALLTPRIIAQTAGRYRQLELDEAIFARSKELFAQALQGDKQLTRDEMQQLLEQANISTAGQRGYHILVRAAQDGLICFGAPSGKQQTFALLDEWAPQAKSLERDEALAELARRYPLQCIVPPNRFFLNSSFSQSDRLRRRQGTPTVMISGEDAAARGVADGDPVRVAS